MNFLTILLITATLVGCSFGKDPGIESSQEVADRQKLRETFSKVTGVYAGQLKTSSSIQDIELSLFTDEVKDGINSDGTDRYRLILKGSYSRLNPAGMTETMGARYIPETRELILSNLRNDLGPDDVRTISGIVADNKITGEVKRSTGVIGQIELLLQTKQSEGNETNERERQNERIRKTLETIAGKWQGTVLPPPNISTPFAIGVDLFVVDVAGANGAIPQLGAFYKRLDDPSGSLDLSLTATYDAELSPPKITLSGRGGGTYAVSLEGNLTADGKIKGVFKNQRGTVGNFVLERK